jgi:hypothetical protein
MALVANAIRLGSERIFKSLDEIAKKKIEVA